MKALWMKLLWRIISRLIGSEDLILAIGDYVKEAARLDVSGKEKKESVDAALKSLTGELHMVYRETSTWLINIAIEAAVGKLKEGAG